MFNSVILKSYILDNIIILIPHSSINPNILICISHGSAGLGENEWHMANFFLKSGIQVALIDYFSSYGITKLYWDYSKNNQDNHSVSFKTMFDNICFPSYEKIIHIGCSLGGFFGIYHAEKFVKNYCFYPGIISFTKSMINKSYKNTTVFLADKDNWCDNYNVFHDQCCFPPQIKNIDAYHGFMSPNKNMEIPVAKYHLPLTPISNEEFSNVIANHKYLSSLYSFNKEKILLQYNENQCIICLDYILEEIINL